METVTKGKRTQNLKVLFCSIYGIHVFVEALGSTISVLGESRLMIFLWFRESSSQGFLALLQS